MNDESIQNEPMIQGPGKKLKEAREKANLTANEIAQQIYLTTSKVIALEEDNYSFIDGVTFIRGYIRAYAKVVNLDPKELVADFDAMGLADKPAFMPIQVLHKKKNLWNDRLLYGLTSGILLLLLIAIMIWWYNHGTVRSNSNLLTLSHPDKASLMVVAPEIQAQLESNLAKVKIK